MESFKPYKSTGNDGICPIVLQKSAKVIMKPLVGILKAVLALGYVLKTRRDVVVMFIPKNGRNDYDIAGSYRPISLTSFLLKTLERMCNRYIRDNILSKRPLHKNQHAYQSGQSVDTTLHQIVNNLEKNMNINVLTLATFIDLEGQANSHVQCGEIYLRFKGNAALQREKM